MRMTEKECYLYAVSNFNKWEKLEINELGQICRIIVISKNIRKSYLDTIDKQLRIILSGLTICKSNNVNIDPEKKLYINTLKKFNIWENLTLKELKQISEIIGANWTLKKEAIQALDAYKKKDSSHLKRIK